ncbi:MAG: cyclic nucleotide-binding domain-containing protein [Candidatus Brocadiales bacterium]|nr:cyclic nucleotide-binding domain-containing protein [Candidatus Brocadiales bacterium]
MEESGLERTYHNGDVIIRQGEKGEQMYVIQSGRVEVIRENSDKSDNPLRITELDEGDFFGTVPLFGRVSSMGKVRSTIRALGDVQVITIDRKTLFRKINEDPSLAYQILETMSRRIMELEEMVSRQNNN